MTAAAKNKDQQSLYQFNTTDLSSFSSETSNIKQLIADIYDVYEVQDVTPKHMIGFNLKKHHRTHELSQPCLPHYRCPDRREEKA